MADFYHLCAKIGRRSKGQSAVAAAAYRAGEQIERKETACVFDYRRKTGIVNTVLLLPPQAPNSLTRAELWNRVEAKETRSNSQLWREIEVALPNKLSNSQAFELVKLFAKDCFVALGMAADICLHRPAKSQGDVEENFHAHIMLTMRRFDATQPDGWAKSRARDWNDRSYIKHWREAWAEFQNICLKALGLKDRVTHRSLKDQRRIAQMTGNVAAAEELDRPPQIKLGPAVHAIERRAKIEAQNAGKPYVPVTDRGALAYRIQQAAGVLKAARHKQREVMEAIAQVTAELSAQAPSHQMALPASQTTVRPKAVQANPQVPSQPSPESAHRNTPPQMAPHHPKDVPPTPSYIAPPTPQAPAPPQPARRRRRSFKPSGLWNEGLPAPATPIEQEHDDVRSRYAKPNRPSERPTDHDLLDYTTAYELIRSGYSVEDITRVLLTRSPDLASRHANPRAHVNDRITCAIERQPKPRPKPPTPGWPQP